TAIRSRRSTRSACAATTRSSGGANDGRARETKTVMALASLYFANKALLWPVTLGAAAALAFVTWTYVRTPAPPALRLGCAALKLCGLVALLLCLLEPT